MPIKWLAPESLDHKREFTHKSDVWSYGITLWELCTFGDRPYKDVTNFKDMPRLLKQGRRLERPIICSQIFYEMLRRCWEEIPDDRPRFEELVVSLGEMLKWPKKFLKIKPENQHPPQSIHYHHLRTEKNHPNHPGYLSPASNSEPPILYSNLMLHKQKQKEDHQQPSYVNTELEKNKPQTLSEIGELTYIPSLSDLANGYKNDFSPGFLDRPLGSTTPYRPAYKNHPTDFSYVPYEENISSHLLASNKKAQQDHGDDNNDRQEESFFMDNCQPEQHDYYNQL